MGVATTVSIALLVYIAVCYGQLEARPAAASTASLLQIRNMVSTRNGWNYNNQIFLHTRNESWTAWVELQTSEPLDNPQTQLTAQMLWSSVQAFGGDWKDTPQTVVMSYVSVADCAPKPGDLTCWYKFTANAVTPPTTPWVLAEWKTSFTLGSGQFAPDKKNRIELVKPCSVCPGDTDCKLCVTGACTEVSLCQDSCPAGAEFNGSACVACAPGWYSNGGSVSCSPCILPTNCSSCFAVNGSCASCDPGLSLDHSNGVCIDLHSSSSSQQAMVSSSYQSASHSSSAGELIPASSSSEHKPAAFSSSSSLPLGGPSSSSSTVEPLASSGSRVTHSDSQILLSSEHSSTASNPESQNPSSGLAEHSSNQGSGYKSSGSGSASTSPLIYGSSSTKHSDQSAPSGSDLHKESSESKAFSETGSITASSSSDASEQQQLSHSSSSSSWISSSAQPGNCSQTPFCSNCSGPSGLCLSCIAGYTLNSQSQCRKAFPVVLVACVLGGTMAVLCPLIGILSFLMFRNRYRREGFTRIPDKKSSKPEWKKDRKTGFLVVPN